MTTTSSSTSNPAAAEAAAAEEDWETCDLDKLRLNDTASIPGAPESVRRQQQILRRPAAAGGRDQQQQQQPQDDSLDFLDDSSSGPSSYRPSGLSSAGAIAVSTVEHDAPFDPALTAALDDPRERVTVLKFEDQILCFMRTPGSKQVDFPPLSSYHRLIVHRLAQRFQLDHQAVDTWGQPNEQRSVILFKTPQSAVPRVLLIDLVSEKRAETAAPKPGLKLMRRERPGDGNGRGGEAGRGPGGQGGTPEGVKGPGSNKSVSERERAYAEARARIFGTKSGSSEEGQKDAVNSGDASRQQQPQQQQQQPAGNGPATNGSSSSSSSRNSNSQQSGSPPVRQEDRKGGKDPSSKDGQGRNSSSNSSSPGDRDMGREGESSRRAAVNAREWVDQRKVTWRNREAELSDPDFVRNHNAYRPSPSSSVPPPPPPPVSSGPYPAYGMAPPVQQQQQVPPHGYMMAPPQMAYMAPAYYTPAMHHVDYSRLPPGAMPMAGPYGVYPGGPMPANAYGVRRASPPPPPPANSQGAPSSSSDYNSAFPPLG